MLQLYNTLTRTKEPFQAITPGQVNLYVCGMTVYDHAHVGHSRVWVVFDVLIRYLQTVGYYVNYVRNITDIDDKIIQRALQNQESIEQLTHRMILSMHADMQSLGLLKPTQEPRATEHIATIITLIQQLLQKNLAYVASNGDVYYAINRFKNYGQLAHQKLEELLSGARVAIVNDKSHPLDFVLWKRNTNETTIGWETPWGRGRPGWHIECSAMAMTHLGASLDIHGGGADLVFPHHQNEVAQSEGATDKPFVNTWMHVGFVQTKDEKMSKSAGNALSIKTLLQRYSGDTVRLFLLSSHYRSPLVYQEAKLMSAFKGLQRLKQATREAKVGETTRLNHRYTEKFYAALEDDLNTPKAIAVLFDMAREVNRSDNQEQTTLLATAVKQLANVLGLLADKTREGTASADQAWIQAQIQQRRLARLAGQWEEADRIRNQLLTKGITLKDTAEGTDWEIQPNLP